MRKEAVSVVGSVNGYICHGSHSTRVAGDCSIVAPGDEFEFSYLELPDSAGGKPEYGRSGRPVYEEAFGGECTNATFEIDVQKSRRPECSGQIDVCHFPAARSAQAGKGRFYSEGGVSAPNNLCPTVPISA